MTCPTLANFSIGDVVSLPVWGQDRIEGTIRVLDVKKGRVRWRGLAVVSRDGTCWEFRSELARPVDPKK